MASPTVNVVRWSALIFGVTYGLMHQSTLQAKYDDQKTKSKAAHRAHLIEDARKAYAAKQASDKSGPSKLVTDIEDPKFDLEKLVNHFIESS